MKSFKELGEPHELTSSYLQDSIPVIDYSLLTSIDPDKRSQSIQEIDKACKNWGCFEVINHGVSETLMNMIIRKSEEFFSLTSEEKKDFENKDATAPIKYGARSNGWRDFIKVVVHPEFHSPNKPLGLREVLIEYSKRTREVFRELLSGISMSLGLDQSYVEKALKLESGFQTCGANIYSPCPQPEAMIGLGPHTDSSLLTLLIDSGVSGLQVKKNDKWVDVKVTLPNSFLAIVADQLEIFSNGMYKAAKHRVLTNNTTTRVSVNVTNGPSLDAVVMPTYNLVDEERYHPMKYKEYLEILDRIAKDSLDRLGPFNRIDSIV